VFYTLSPLFSKDRTCGFAFATGLLLLILSFKYKTKKVNQLFLRSNKAILSAVNVLINLCPRFFFNFPASAERAGTLAVPSCWNLFLERTLKNVSVNTENKRSYLNT
jgi:hypothetical protein